MEYEVIRKRWELLVIDGKLTNYYISDFGDIYSARRKKMMIPFDTHNGYHRIGLNIDGKPRQYAVHRLVGFMFVEGYKEGLTINHEDGKKKNNYYKNLTWMTQADNEKHATENGLKAHGERHFGNIYSEKAIHEVCKLLEKYVSYDEIVKKTGVDLKVVYDVKNRKSWVYVSDNYNIPTEAYTRHAKLRAAIYNLFEQGYKTKKIIEILELPQDDKAIKSMLNRLRWKYNKGEFVVQRLSPEGT